MNEDHDRPEPTYFVYPDQHQRIATVSRLGPQTNRAAQDCAFEGTKQEVVKWAKDNDYSLVWR